jgi:lipopolysaccharide/colanic/teichoic acid biosynthesis glycosyltransferase
VNAIGPVADNEGGAQQPAYVSKPAYEAAKRVLDLFGAVTGLLLLAPVMLVAGTAVALSSPGPVLYQALRTGRHGVPFRILKFRSMVEGAEQGAGSTSRADPRVTAVGRVLRRHKIDELPQLINILLGEMSVVGPRPELARYTDLYTGDELDILKVRPGLTDLSSIAFANLDDLLDDDDPDRSFQERILPKKNHLRLEYIRLRSFWLDLSLILQTLLQVSGVPWNRE